eukprot:CAMPEP_0197652922 /NCGR_PEP_ID=MMETSP1338-20131121/34740_1 /TAXON_ID=43686 ORGANISM="Pelagodinium beii, Strain RCC1491" /NCGR_SAMPLE_ID=MMETSP1338 /ASSEMBLY_ACC=CAM_ASM_000754 /LENGTH=525 /DNA_ID=CAMNT_0043227891 /DNA_START=61 /DNA_END=1638 /DNA_ORIENTATION=-
MACGVLAFALLLAAANASQSSPNKLDPEHLPWHMNVRTFHFPELFAKDLFADNESLHESLSTLSSKYVILDFYAPWCPHCQHFAPDFERLALAIQSSEKSAKPKLQAGVVDCVKYMAACKKFGVDGFPSLKYGKRKDFMNFNLDAIKSVELENRSAETVADWIRNESKQTISIDVSKVSKADITKRLLTLEGKSDQTVKASGSRRTGGDVWDAKLAAGLLLRSIFETKAFNTQPSGDMARATLFQVLGLFSQTFPEEQAGGACRSSFTKLSENLGTKWQDHLQKNRQFFFDTEDGIGYDGESMQSQAFIDPDTVESQWQLCNVAWDDFSKGWGSCRGSWPQKRGYTCGLWTLMHFTAAGSTDSTALRNTEMLRSMIREFFGCTDCRDHFAQIPYEKSMIQSQKDMQLWWWDAHNQVNERVRKIEEEGEDGDPAFPKKQFPDEALCAECRSKPASLLRMEEDFPRHQHRLHGHHGNSKYMQRLDAEPNALREKIAAKGWNVAALENFLAQYYKASVSSPLLESTTS